MSCFCVAGLACRPAESFVEADPAEYATNSSLVEPGTIDRPDLGVVAASPVVDLGHVIAEGQKLRCEFRLVNSSRQPVDLTGADALVPCCTRVDPLPAQTLPPGGDVAVAVEYRPGFDAGPKRLPFVISTNSVRARSVTLTLAATLHPAWSVQRIAGGSSVVVRRSGRLRYRIEAHRRAEAGRSLPESWAAEGPITVRAAEPLSEETLAGGIIAQRRDLEIDTLPRDVTGLHRATLVFRWLDGHVTREDVAWVVDPTVTVSPTGLVIRASVGPVDQTLTVRSGERPIRILAVSGPALAAPVVLPDGPARLHSLAMHLKPNSQDGIQSTIQVITDDADQPETSVNVITIGSPTKEAR